MSFVVRVNWDRATWRVMLVSAATTAMLALVGCSADGTSNMPNSAVEPTSSDPSTSTAGVDSMPHKPCDLLTASELALLAGRPMQEPHPWKVAGLPACQWGTPADVGVQIINVAAGAWARQLPDLVKGIRASGEFDDAENRRKLKKAGELIASGNEIDPSRACNLFSSLLTVQGHPSGSTVTINLMPTRKHPQAISGQTCTRGIHTSVLLVAPGLTGSESEIGRVSTALATAHRRASN